MEDYGFQVARADLLEKAGRLADAAELRLSEGQVTKAIELFVKDAQNETSRRRAEECLLGSFWQHLSFDIIVHQQVDLSSTLIGDLLIWADKTEKLLSAKGLDEVSRTASLRDECDSDNM